MKQERYLQHEKFATFMRPLTESEEENLTEALKASGGADDPVKVWNGYLIDGYNRERICFENGLRYPDAKDMTDQLVTENDVVEWIIINQLGRRNNTENERAKLIGYIYNARTARQEEAMSDAERDEIMSVINDDIDDFVGDMQEEAKPKENKGDIASGVAKEFGVSDRTVRTAGKVAQVYEEMSPEEKKAFDEGKTGIKETAQKAKKKKPKTSRPKKEKAPTPFPGKSAETDTIEREAKAYAAALKGFKDKAAPVSERISETSPAPLQAIKKILDTFIAKVTIELDELSDVFVCEACGGTNLSCGECSLGYADADNRVRQMRIVKDDETYVGKNRIPALNEPAKEPEAAEPSDPTQSSSEQSEIAKSEQSTTRDDDADTGAEDPMEAALRRHPVAPKRFDDDSEEEDEESDDDEPLHPRDDESEDEEAERSGNE